MIDFCPTDNSHTFGPDPDDARFTPTPSRPIVTPSPISTPSSPYTLNPAINTVTDTTASPDSVWPSLAR